MTPPFEPAGTPAIGPILWVKHLTSEYLSSFIKDGGAAVKFAVDLDDRAGASVGRLVGEKAESLGYFVARLNAEDTAVHMIDQIFFRVAEQVPWPEVSERIVTRLASDIGYRPPTSGEGPMLERFASANGIDTKILSLDLRKQIGSTVSKERSLSRDFRVAMTQLCLAQLAGGQDGQVAMLTLIDWLTGRNKAVSAVKPYQIFSRINRATARHLFESLLHWLRTAGYAGTTVLLDIARVSVPKNPKDGKLWYTKPAMLDAYEVLRQFIDST